jgi:hypothetical protein
MDFLLMKNKRWGKTHVQMKPIYGASLCRAVDEYAEGTTLEDLKNEIPTCMDCRLSLITLALTDVKLPNAIALSILHYVRYAHRQEKYHGAKIIQVKKE